jgi:hypothetical protein
MADTTFFENCSFEKPSNDINMAVLVELLKEHKDMQKWKREAMTFIVRSDPMSIVGILSTLEDKDIVNFIRNDTKQSDKETRSKMVTDDKFQLVKLLEISNAKQSVCQQMWNALMQNYMLGVTPLSDMPNDLKYQIMAKKCKMTPSNVNEVLSSDVFKERQSHHNWSKLNTETEICDVLKPLSEIKIGIKAIQNCKNKNDSQKVIIADMNQNWNSIAKYHGVETCKVCNGSKQDGVGSTIHILKDVNTKVSHAKSCKNTTTKRR